MIPICIYIHTCIYVYTYMNCIVCVACRARTFSALGSHGLILTRAGGADTVASREFGLLNFSFVVGSPLGLGVYLGNCLDCLDLRH